jgi:hypothetical protein
MTMANRAEQKKGPRIAELPEHRRPLSDHPGAPAPSVPAALEKLASATQRVISKRIDLVALESHELLSSLIMKGGLIAFGVVTGLAAWITAIAALVLWLMPDSGTPLRLAVYAGINAAVGAIVVAFALREKLPPLTAEVEDENAEHRAGEEANVRRPGNGE